MRWAVTGGTPAVQYGYDLSVTSSIYNDGARLESMTYPGASRVLFYTYGTGGGVEDQLNRPKEIRKTNGTGTILSDYQWTAAGRLAQADYGVTAGQPDVRSNYYNNDADDEYEAYDRFGRVAYTDWYRYSGTATSLDQYDYTYDRVGNRKTRDLDSTAVSGAPTTRDHLYTYDQLYRLKNFDEGQLVAGSISGTPVSEQDFTLQQLGNWATFDKKVNGSYTLQQARTHNDVNEIDTNNNHSDTPGDSISLQSMGAGSNWIDPKYDAAGNLIEAPKPAAETTRHKYTYDAWNRLVAVKDNADATIATFAYDGLGRRIQKVDVAANPDITYDYYYNEAWQVVEVRKNGSANPLEQFAWHAYYIDAPLVRFYDDNTDGAGIVEHYYGHDAQFNVTVVHDVSANVVERYTYTPYGELVIMTASWGTISSSAIANAYTYTGREYDAETGLFNFRNRYYHAQLGRFVNRDPIGYYGGGFNLYAGYFVPDWMDPLGLDTTIFNPFDWVNMAWEADLKRKEAEIQTKLIQIESAKDPFGAIDTLNQMNNRRRQDAANSATQLAIFGVGWTSIVLGGAFVTSSGAAFTLDDLSSAAARLDPADKAGQLTKAGRALQKHGNRPRSAFPRAAGNPSQINCKAQEIVDDILTTPGSKIREYPHPRFGEVVEVVAPDGRGVLFGVDGRFIGFLEPPLIK